MTVGQSEVHFSCTVAASLWVAVQSASFMQPEWGYFFEQEEQGPGSYSFGYDIEEPPSQNVQFRREKRFPNGTVTGSYGLVEPDGNVRIVSYTADDLGYRAIIENSHRPNEVHPAPPPPAPAWDSHRFWDMLWDSFNDTHGEYPPRSPTLDHAVDSLQTLGQPVEEQHTPPAALGHSTSSDQSQNFPSFLQAPLDLTQYDLPSRR